ncbi:hypothetical protein RUND412_004034 [Rhizina undulata]
MPLLSQLPVELLKLVAVELSDDDLARFCLVSKRFHEVVCNDQVVWRGRFLREFEGPRTKLKAYNWRLVYEARRRMLRRLEVEAADVVGVAEVFWDMVLDSNLLRDSSHTHPTSQNIEFLANHPFLLIPSVKRLPPVVSTLRLFMFPLHKSLHITTHTLSYLQRIVYDSRNFPIFPSKGSDAPDVWVLEAMCAFFHWHVDKESESRVFSHRMQLPREDSMGLWEGPLGAKGEEGAGEGRWLGAYTYPNLPGLQVVFLDPSTSLVDRSDGYLMDAILCISPTSTDPDHSYRKITGSGSDFRPFTLSGNLLPIPAANRPVEGWSKVSFVKDYSSHKWLYEGVMVPGGHMILGRWRSCELEDAEGCGPFIFWRASQ